MKFLLKALTGILLGAVFFLPLYRLAAAQAAEPQTIDPSAARRSRYPGKDWNAEKTAREAWARHAFNKQRLERDRSEGLTPNVPAISVADVADVSVVQDDGSVVIPANSFDLAGRSVLFTPSGNGYTVTGGASAFETSLGTKLDLTRAPAVNPKTVIDPRVEPGDDAYITQPLGFNFSFYGASYANLTISSNGFLVFRPANVGNQYFDDNAVDSGEALSSLQTALPRIAPYWHDLDARAASTTGASGIYMRTDADKVVVTYNNISDFPNRPGDNGVHRFQAILFRDGRIQFNYEQAQLTSMALAGIAGGENAPSPVLVNFASPAGGANTAPLAEFFTNSPGLDELNAIKAFYTAHPGQDVYDFIYVLLDFNFDFGDGTIAYYQPGRNDISGNGQPTFNADPYGLSGSAQRLRGFLELSSLNGLYPEYPTTRFLGANHALSVIGQEQGHYWLAYPAFPQISRTLLLGRDNDHWSFFFNVEASLSKPAARRSSSMEGNVLRENSDGTFTTVGLIDGYTKLDQYLMGLRPASEVPESFVLTNVVAPFGITRMSEPRPNVTMSGTKVPVTIAQIVQANGGEVSPGPTPGVTKNYRAAVLLIEQAGRQPTAQSLNKLTRYRLAWESYFAQSTDFLASINTGIAAASVARAIAVVSAASFVGPLVPGSLGAIFGAGLTNGVTLSAPGQPLPTNLGGVEVRIDGTSAPLFFVSPGQINFQLPRNIAATTTLLSSGTVQSSTATLEVFRDGQLIRAAAVQVAPVQAGVFALAGGAAAALDAITFAPAPFNARQANGQPNILALFLTGLGADVTDNDGNVNTQVQATLSGQATTVQYAGRAPGLVGVNQINFQFPANLAAGTYNLVVTRNGFASNVTTIAIR
jgi:uncharacterized protein (TIGR03437 family)